MIKIFPFLVLHIKHYNYIIKIINSFKMEIWIYLYLNALIQLGMLKWKIANL